jgi:5'-3' exonuclease
VKSFYIIDGHYQIYRAFYGLQQPLTSPTGEPTGATHLFCAMLFGLIRDRKPDYLAMVMDVSDETVFRREIDSDYKAHRDPAPEALGIQADRIVTIVQALGVPIYRKPGFEADDLMATITERLRNEDVMIYLVSRDKDLDQLLSDRVRLLDPTTGEITDPQRLLEKKGYLPDKAVEIQTLVGDSTDNIHGVNGVGPKTAVKLIAQYCSAAETIAHADEQTPKLKERLLEFAPRLDATRQLVTLRRDVPDFERGARDHSDPVRPIFEERFLLMETLQSPDIAPDLCPSKTDPTIPLGKGATPPSPFGRGTQGGLDFERHHQPDARAQRAMYSWT